MSEVEHGQPEAGSSAPETAAAADEAPEPGTEPAADPVAEPVAGEPAEAEPVAAEPVAVDRVASLEREGDVAADYLEGLLDIADLDGDIDLDVENDRAMVSVVGDGLQHLVGHDGEVLDALQELTRLAVIRETGERSRLMLDIGGFRAARRAQLTDLGRQAAEEVRASGEPMRLSVMTPFERKVVHDAIAAAGLRSESEGEEPQRRVVVLPA